MFTTSRKSQAGFSLVELMVVVAIIGVLASIAVPQINKYLAKARQTEAKTILASIYTSEKAFYAEYTGYHAMFGAIGYSPEGRLRYNAGFVAPFTNAGVANGYENPPTAAPGIATTTSAYCGLAGAFLNGCTTLNGVAGGAPLAPTNTSMTVNSFTAGANGNIFGAANDNWTINEQKNLLNNTPGIQ